MNEYTPIHNHISIRDQSCPNKFCQFFGKKLQGNVIVHTQTAKRIKCNACNKTWVSRRQEASYRLRGDPTNFNHALAMLQQGFSIRKIAGNLKVSPSTILRWKKRIRTITPIIPITPTN